MHTHTQMGQGLQGVAGRHAGGGHGARIKAQRPVTGQRHARLSQCTGEVGGSQSPGLMVAGYGHDLCVCACMSACMHGREGGREGGRNRQTHRHKTTHEAEGMHRQTRAEISCADEMPSGSLSKTTQNSGGRLSLSAEVKYICARVSTSSSAVTSTHWSAISPTPIFLSELWSEAASISEQRQMGIDALYKDSSQALVSSNS